MKGFLITVSAILALAHAAPQGVEFTAKEYEALQQVLGNRVPVAIQSAIRVLAGVESNPTDFYVLRLNGLGSPVARTGTAVSRTGAAAAAATVTAEDAAPATAEAAAPAAAAAAAIPVARTGTVPTDDDVAETFSEVAEEAVDNVREAADEAAEENEVEEGVNRTQVTNTLDSQTETIAVTEANSAAPADETVPEENTVDSIAVEESQPEDTARPAADETAGVVSRTGVAAVAEEEDPAAVEEAANAVAAIEEEAEATAVEAARRKRQQDSSDEEEPTIYATELAFGLSALGNLYGGNIGRFLDESFNAHLTFIENMERTNLLVLDQVEEMISRVTNNDN